MELLERYLQAVKFWLPKEQKQDIIAELSEDLHSQIEEKEAELGRKLTAIEVEFLLKQRKIAGLAVDTVSTEAMALAGGKKPIPFPVHYMVHGAKKYQIEMLANTDSLPATGALLIVAPVKVQNGSGAPARIYALVGS